MEKKKYFIAMPNVSAGADPEVYEKIVDEARNVEGVTLVSYEPNKSFNRTVINIIGEEHALMDVIVNIAGKCKELIDMREHVGTHPRMGALDTCNIFPYVNTDVNDAIAFVEVLGKKIFDKYQVPVYLTEFNGKTEFRSSHVNLRSGQYEGIKKLLKETKDDPNRQEEYENRKPDYSVDGLLSETYGGSLVYAEKNIKAFHNIFLGTEDLSIAKKIAKKVRGKTGGFSTVTAIGIKFEGYEGVCVSINISNTELTPIYQPFRFIKEEAARYGVPVISSELIGVVRLEPMIDCVRYLLQLDSFETSNIIETHQLP